MQPSWKRQAALRNRRAKEGLKELRGLYVTAAEEITIKKEVRAWLKRTRKNH